MSASSLPRCSNCGNERGPWKPSGEVLPSCEQLFVCQDGCPVAELAAAVAEHGPFPMPSGEPMPVELTEEQAEALAAAGNRAVNDQYHKDLCHCEDWPTGCVSRGNYFMGTWDTSAFDIGLPAVLGVWESLRNDRHAAKIAELRAEVSRQSDDVTGACLARHEEEQDNARLRLALASAKRRAMRRLPHEREGLIFRLEQDNKQLYAFVNIANEAARVHREAREGAQSELKQLRTRVAELEALKPARFQDCQVCGAGYEYGQPCTQCQFKKLMAEGPGALPRDLSPELARRIEQNQPETNTSHECNLPLTRRLDCGHCPHEVCQDCQRCPHTCRCASPEDPHDSPLRHRYDTPRDLPEVPW